MKSKKGATVLALSKPTAQDEAAYRRMVQLTAEVRRARNLRQSRILFGLAQHLLHVMESGKYRAMPAALQNTIRQTINVANSVITPSKKSSFAGKRAAQQIATKLGIAKATYLKYPTIAQFQALAREIVNLTARVRSTGNRELAITLRQKIAQLEQWSTKAHIKAGLLKLPSNVQQSIVAAVATAKQIANAAINAGADSDYYWDSSDDDYYWDSSSSSSGDAGGYYSLPDDMFDDEDEEDYYDDEDDWSTDASDGAYWSTDENEIDVDDLEFLDDGEQWVDDEVMDAGGAVTQLPEPTGLVDRITGSLRAHPLLWGAGALGAAYLGHRYWQSRQV